jgi:hypothetical protein
MDPSTKTITFLALTPGEDQITFSFAHPQSLWTVMGKVEVVIQGQESL